MRVLGVHEEVSPGDVHRAETDAALHQQVLSGPHVGDLPGQRVDSGSVPLHELGHGTPGDALGQEDDRIATDTEQPHIGTLEICLAARTDVVGMSLAVQRTGAQDPLEPLVGGGSIVDGQGQAMEVAGLDE